MGGNRNVSQHPLKVFLRNMMGNWTNAQKWESSWWGNCVNTYQEETKQLVYAEKMGLRAEMIEGKFPVYTLGGASILDIGGGPVSILLKCKDSFGVVVDPCEYPAWVLKRYHEAKIRFFREKGEDFENGVYDEVWIYNVLQHCESPQKITKKAREASKIIRIFEWLETEPNEGHPHVLTEGKLNYWLGGEGKVEEINDRGCVGKCFYGIFKGDNYGNNC